MERRKRSFTLRTDAAKVIEEDTGWHCRNAARVVGRVLDRHLAPTGLTATQFGLLCLIASAKRDTMGELAVAAGLEQSTLTRISRRWQRPVGLRS